MRCAASSARIISIPAPPRGATDAKYYNDEGRDISIPAPPRGATSATFSPRTLRLFQFTPLREGATARTISAHTPSSYFNSRPSARGDRESCARRIRSGYFNSRPSARGDLREKRSSFQTIFQFTPLREGRQCSRLLPGGLLDFNSRPSARGDLYNTPSIAFAEFRYTPKPRCSRFGCCIHIISNNNQHFFTSRQTADSSQDPRAGHAPASWPVHKQSALLGFFLRDTDA